MRAMLLAAGLGTRLQPLTDERAKAVVPVLGRPLGGYALAHVAAQGVRRVAFNTHHLGDLTARGLQESAPSGVELLRSHEPQILGTGGGVRQMGAALGGGDAGPDADPCFVLNADILFAPDLGAALALHVRLGAIATMVVRRDPDAERYGAIDVSGDGRVRRLLGIPDGDGDLRRTMFTGIHVLSARAVDEMPKRGCIIRRAYRQWVDRGEVVAAHIDEAPWRDLGTPARYLDANLDVLVGRLRLPGLEPPGDRWVHPTARVGQGASLHACVVGAGAAVAPGVQLRRAVVWDGARVTEDVEDAVVTPQRIVRVLRG